MSILSRQSGRGWSVTVALHLIAIGAVLAWVSPLSAQPYPRDRHSQQLQWFHDQRAYPFHKIPSGAYQAARQDYDKKWGSQALQPSQVITTNAWTQIGPDHISTSLTTSGRTNTLAIDPTNPNIIYAGGAQGGVWKTINGGTSWTPLTDNQCSTAMGSIAVDPVNPNIIYAGTGEENFSGDSFYGCGVLRSTDGGTTWTQLGASTFVISSGGGRSISRVFIDPSTAGSTTATRVLVSASSGVYRSTDSGSSWTQVMAGTATDVIGDPSTPSTLYAALGNIFGASSNGVYKSTNGGDTWTQLSGGLPTTNVGRINIAIAPSSPSTLYANVQNKATFGLLGVWKSADGGTSWTQLSATGASCGNQCWYDMYIYVDPTNANTIYFGGLGIYKSTNGGASFSEIAFASGVHTDQHALAFQPGNPLTIYAGNDGGIFKSTNGGSTWVSLNTNYATTQFYPGVALDPTNPANAIGGLQDNDVVLYNGSNVWDSAGLGCDGGFTAIDFATPTTKYGECQGGGFYSGPQRSDGGGAFVQKVSGINLNDNMQFIPPISMSPSNSQALYFGTFRVYKTVNRGDAWTAISPDLSAGAGQITSIAEAKSNSQVIFAGTTDGRVQVTTNGGTNWTLITTGLPNRTVTYLAVDPTNAQNAFVTVSGFGTGHVFKTTNSGASWSDISGNLPNIPVHTILVDPGAPTTNIYIGTDLGVFRTSDGGSTWAAFNTGLPNVAVFDLVFNQASGVMVAATHGRGMWKATNTAVPTLQVSPTTDIVASGQQGGTFSPSSFQYQLSASTGSVDFSISGIPTWLTASFVSGTAPTSPLTVTFTVNANANTLAPGSYGPTAITFTNTTNGQGNTTRTATLTVTAKTYTIAVSASPSGGGTVSGGGTFTVGSSQTVVATPNGGYTFANWTENGSPVSSSASYNFTLNANRTLVANFTAIVQTYAIAVSASPSAGGTVSGGGTFAAGSSQTVVATPNSGYTFANWTENGSAVSSSASYSFTLNANRTLVANFTAIVQSYTIAVSASPSAGGTVSGGGSFTAGTSQTVVATPNSGYTFASWTENGSAVSSSASYNFTLNANRTLVANFTLVITPSVTHDFNGDGKSDILWRNSDGTVGMWLMNGTQILSTLSFGILPLDWTVVGTGDFNGDSKADILWRNSDGTVGLWLMKGAQVVSTTSFGNLPLDWTIVGAGDFNGDGKSDILWRNTDGTVGMWLMNGPQIVSTTSFGVLPLSWTIAGTGDFDGDGKTDILWRNSDGTLGLWLMNGAQIVSTTSFGNLPLDWTIVGTGDFNGDSKTDILWRNSDGTVGLWLMNGAQLISTTSFGVLPASWSIFETGDFNGDGNSDILWRNADGTVGLWFMNGTQVVSTSSFGVLPASWTIQGANTD